MDWFHFVVRYLVKAVSLPSSIHRTEKSKLKGEPPSGPVRLSTPFVSLFELDVPGDDTDDPVCPSLKEPPGNPPRGLERQLGRFTAFHIKRWQSLSRLLRHAFSSPALLTEKARESPQDKGPALGSKGEEDFSAEKLLLVPAPALLWWHAVMLGIFSTPAALCVGMVLLLRERTVPLLAAWAGAEVLFLLCRAVEWRRVSREIVDEVIPSRAEASQLLDQVLSLRCMGVVQPEEYLSGWFLGAPASALSRSCVRDFLAFGLYHRDFNELPGDIRAAVEEHLVRVEQRWELDLAAAATSRQHSTHGSGGGGKRSSGHLASDLASAVQEGILRLEAEARPAAAAGGGSGGRGDARRPAFMAHTREPLRAFLHPLALYAWGHMVGALTSVAMRAMGFRRRVCPSTGLTYFVFTRTAANGQTAAHCHQLAGEADEGGACVFVHGLGVGITPYLGFIRRLLHCCPHKAVVVPELPHLAYRICTNVPTMDQLVRGLEEVVASCVGPTGQVCLVGHSYGSLILAQYVRSYRSRVASLGLIDPVCILLCLPNVIYNFVYKVPCRWEGVRAVVADTLRWVMCSRELNVARTLCRNFNWHTMHLWAHQMPPHTLVMLAEDDRIVPTSHVRRYLESEGVPLMFNRHMGHAQFLARPDVQHTFLRRLFEMGSSKGQPGQER